MGVGNRFKKQGPPPDLGKTSFSSQKKRKAGDGDSARGKKRRTSGEQLAVQPPKPSKAAVNGTKNSGVKATTKGNFANGKPTQKEKGKIAKAQLPAGSSEEEDLDEDDADLLGSEISDDDAADLLNDEFGDLEDDSLKSGEGSDDATDSAFDSEEEQGANRAMFSDDDESDAEEKLTAANIEGLSRKLDAQTAQDAAEATAELQASALQTNIADESTTVPLDETPQTTLSLAPDLQLLRTRITETLRVLENFSSLSKPERSRADYTTQLHADICLYYGYSPYLASKLLDLFTPKEAFAFFEANETPRPLVLRTNTLRTSRRNLAHALIARGVTLEPVGSWSKVGLQVFESQVPLGATPEYLAGHYILQAASSFLPVMALAPQEGERVLDMASAPGGKTTHIAALMKNTGCIFANDSNKARAKALIGNIHRLGAKNTIVCNHDAREFPKIIGGFDRVLLDAPCSGTGVIAKDPSVKTNKTEKDFMLLPHLQKQLLLSAIDSVDHTSKTGGYIVYSTCSVTVEENEQVVQYALNKRPNVKLVDTGLVFGDKGFTSYRGKKFHESLNKTRRYYPHRFNVDGFFVSKFKKTGPSPTASGSAANAKMSTNGGVRTKDDEDVDGVDATPIGEEDTDGVNGEFGGFDESEDERYMERAEKSRLKRKGVNPKGVGGKKAAEAREEKSKEDEKVEKKSLEKEEKVNGDAKKLGQDAVKAAAKEVKKKGVKPKGKSTTKS